MRCRSVFFHAILAFVVLLSLPTLADSGANHQVRNLHFGVSGGNINDQSRAYCCSGTLGSLVHDTSNIQYILSNNHVLGLSGKAAPGDDISQPGLIDNGCRVPPIVADFSTAPALGSNVDAAIAILRPGQMDSTGFIEDIGIPSNVVAQPALGLAVEKSGRTTGLTTGNISSINATVRVQYQQGCGKGKKFTISYTNQIVVNSSTFSAGGDSGSLIVVNDSCHQPVGLLFAGSSTTTIGNPAGEVLQKVSSSLGATVNFVGNTCTTVTPFGGTPQTANEASALTQTKVERATQIKEFHAPRLMADPAVMAVGVGSDPGNPGEAAIHIYVERGRVHQPIPDNLDGVPTVVMQTDLIRAFGWNEPDPQYGSCKLN